MPTFGQKLEFAHDMLNMETADPHGNDSELRIVDEESILTMLDELRCDTVNNELLDCSNIGGRSEDA